MKHSNATQLHSKTLGECTGPGKHEVANRKVKGGARLNPLKGLKTNRSGGARLSLNRNGGARLSLEILERNPPSLKHGTRNSSTLLEMKQFNCTHVKTNSNGQGNQFAIDADAVQRATVNRCTQTHARLSPSQAAEGAVSHTSSTPRRGPPKRKPAGRLPQILSNYM